MFVMYSNYLPATFLANIMLNLIIRAGIPSKNPLWKYGLHVCRARVAETCYNTRKMKNLMTYN